MATIHPPGTAPSIRSALAKAPTGIRGFDELTGGGLRPGDPGHRRPRVVQDVVRAGVPGARRPGVRRAGRPAGVRGVGRRPDGERGLARLRPGRTRGRRAPGHRCGPDRCVRDRDDGDFDLDGLFIRLASAVQSVGARRVVLDTIEVLFGALGDEAIVRNEFGRLLRWLKDHELTTVITGERGREGQLTRYGIEEYASDCVIVLDHRMHDEIATRLRVVKYRGSVHGTNEYPFLVTDRACGSGPSPRPRSPTRSPPNGCRWACRKLDEMLGGVYRGSTVLVSGPRAPARRRWRPPRSTRPAPAANRPCSSPSRSPPTRSSAT